MIPNKLCTIVVHPMFNQHSKYEAIQKYFNMKQQLNTNLNNFQRANFSKL